MDRRLGRACFAYALLSIFALMLAFSLLPRSGGPNPVAADLFWMPHQLKPAAPLHASMSARPSSQARISPCGQAHTIACPTRQMFYWPPSSDFSLLDGRLSVLMPFPAMEDPVIPILARRMGGRAPPDYNKFIMHNS